MIVRNIHRPNQMVRMEVASSRPDHLPTLSTAKTSEHSLLAKSLLVAKWSMPALQLRRLLQCADDIEMNPGPVSTPTPINCLRLMQCNTILSENEATRQLTNGRSTSRDISLASNDIAPLSDWSVSTSLASDHLPILITINSELSTINGPRRTCINFKKADWTRYAEAYDKYLAEAGETRTVEQAE